MTATLRLSADSSAKSGPSSMRMFTRPFLPPCSAAAGGNPKPWSDLDIALEGPAPLSLPVMAALAEAFDESALPWKVDIVDRRAAGEALGRIIAASGRGYDLDQVVAGRAPPGIAHRPGIICVR